MYALISERVVFQLQEHYIPRAAKKNKLAARLINNEVLVPTSRQ